MYSYAASRLGVFGTGLLLLATWIQQTKAQNCADSRSPSGHCTTLATCPQLIEQFYDEARLAPSNTMDFQQYVSESFCGFDGSNFLICCPNRLATDPSSRRPARQQPNLPLSMATNAQSSSVFALPPGAIFYFAPLSGSGTSAGSGAAPPALYPGYSQFQSTPPVVFQPTFSNPPSYNTGGPIVPTPPITVFQPTLSGAAPTSMAGCGMSAGSTNRVVGGAEAKRGTYPWIAALGYFEEFDRNTLKFLCGGSLISSTYVATSAHCVTPSLTMVRLGAHDLYKAAERDAVDFRIRRTVVHEGFDLKSIANDIALIQLISPAPTTNAIRPICLPESGSFLTQDFVGMNPFIAGWGATRHQGPTSNVLRDVQVPIIGRATCEQSYRSIFKFVEFSDKLICAGSGNADACQGDSGGPLMMPQLDGNVFRYYLLGIVSYGYECARTGFPGVYTRVATYIPWLRANAV